MGDQPISEEVRLAQNRSAAFTATRENIGLDYARQGNMLTSRVGEFLDLPWRAWLSSTWRNILHRPNAIPPRSGGLQPSL